MLTSYLVANAVVLPIGGWIANRIGRNRFYRSCVTLFTLAYVDVIWILVALTWCLIPLPFLMKRPGKRAAAAEMVH